MVINPSQNPDPEGKFIAMLMDGIRNKRISLPTMPEVAIKVRDAAASPATTAAQLAKLVALDPALSARLLQVANSAMFRGNGTISSIQNAIARLGNALVRNIIASVVVSQLFQARVPATIKVHLKLTWQHTIKTAAISHVLARKFTRLPPEQAMLAGLVHDIGKLPILTQLEDFPELLENPETVDQLLTLLHPQIGRMILEAWQFPPEMVSVAAEHEDLQRNSGPEADFTDIVMIANLQAHLGEEGHASFAEWLTIPAYAKLNLTPEQYLAALSDIQHEILEIQKLLTA